MMIEVLKSKIHCARVTEANLNYMGSITIDEDLLDAANMIAGEKVYIADNNNGERFETYIIKGERGSGKICLNGAAARKVQPDDIVIIMSYALMDFEEAKSFQVIQKDFQMRVKGSGEIPCGFASGGFRCIEKLLVLPFPVISIKAEFVVVCTCRCIVGRLIQVYKLEYSQLIVYVVT